MKQGIDHCGEEEMAPLSPTDRGNQRRRRLMNVITLVIFMVYYFFTTSIIKIIFQEIFDRESLKI